MLYILLIMLSWIHEFNLKYMDTKILDESNGYPHISEILIIQICEK